MLRTLLTWIQLIVGLIVVTLIGLLWFGLL